MAGADTIPGRQTSFWRLFASAVAAAALLGILSRFSGKKAAAPRPVPLEPPPPAPARRPKKAAGEEVQRPKPRRKPYTGTKLRIIEPDRGIRRREVPAAPSRGAPAAPSASAEASPELCPRCGLRSPSGGLCGRCTAMARLNETENLISSLSSKGVAVPPAERLVFQARSAMALEVLDDVMMLCERAQALAREADAAFDEARDRLSRCESDIALAMEAGKETMAAEKALEGATALFQKGAYAAAIEQAGLITLLITGRWRPGGAPPEAGGGPKAAAPMAPAGAAPEAAAAAPAGPHRCGACGERLGPDRGSCPRCGADPGMEAGQAAAAVPDICPECGERLEPDWRSCPNCSARIGAIGERPLANCPVCGRELLASWRICPYCDTDLPAMDARAGEGQGQRRPRVLASERREPPTIPPAMREKGLLEEIERIDRMLDTASARGIDVTKGRNLLELALSFTRNRNYEKGERYLHKARTVAETLLSI